MQLGGLRDGSCRPAVRHEACGSPPAHGLPTGRAPVQSPLAMQQLDRRRQLLYQGVRHRNHSVSATAGPGRGLPDDSMDDGDGPSLADYLEFGRLLGEKPEDVERGLKEAGFLAAQDDRAQQYLQEWEKEEQAMKQMFEALMVGPTRSGGGGGGGSRSNRALLRAKARAVVTPDEREAMEGIVREELGGQASTRSSTLLRNKTRGHWAADAALSARPARPAGGSGGSSSLGSPRQPARPSLRRPQRPGEAAGEDEARRPERAQQGADVRAPAPQRPPPAMSARPQRPGEASADDSFTRQPPQQASAPQPPSQQQEELQQADIDRYNAALQRRKQMPADAAPSYADFAAALDGRSTSTPDSAAARRRDISGMVSRPKPPRREPEDSGDQDDPASSNSGARKRSAISRQTPVSAADRPGRPAKQPSRRRPAGREQPAQQDSRQADAATDYSQRQQPRESPDEHAAAAANGASISRPTDGATQPAAAESDATPADTFADVTAEEPGRSLAGDEPAPPPLAQRPAMRTAAWPPPPAFSDPSKPLTDEELLVRPQFIRLANELLVSQQGFVVTVISANTGGVVVKSKDTGLRGFVPLTQLGYELAAGVLEHMQRSREAWQAQHPGAGNVPEDLASRWRREALYALEGTDLTVCLWSIDRLTNAIVMSQRALRQNGSRAASPPDVPYVEEVLEVLRGNIGAVVEATIVRVVDYGAFAAFDVEVFAQGETRVVEVPGLIHRTEMSWNDVRHIEDIVQVGENVQVVMYGVRVEGGRPRVALSMRRRSPDPLAQTLDDLLSGSSNSGASDGPMDAELPDVGSPRGDGGRGGLDLRSRLGDMPEAVELCRLLGRVEGVFDALPGRRLQSNASSPSVQVLLSTSARPPTEAGIETYELVARRGMDIQIIQLYTRLDRNAVKAAISDIIPQLSSTAPADPADA